MKTPKPDPHKAARLGKLILTVGMALDAKEKLNQPQPFDALGTPLKIPMEPAISTRKQFMMDMNRASTVAQQAMRDGLTAKEMQEGIPISFNNFISLVQLASSVQLLETQVKSLTKRLDNAQWETASAEGRAV